MAIKSMWFPRCLELFIGRLVYYSQLLVLAYPDIRSADRVLYRSSPPLTREDCMKVCSIEICLHGYYILPSALRLAGLRYTRKGVGG